MGTLPPAGLTDTTGLDLGTDDVMAGLLGATLAIGGLLTGVEAAVRQSSC